MKKSFKIFGCKVNRRYAESWLESQKIPEKSVFVSTCRVTDQAQSRWTKHVLKMLSQMPEDQKLYLTGCGVFEGGKIDPDFYKKHPALVRFSHRLELLPEDPSEHQTHTQKPSAFADSLKQKLASLKDAFSTRLHIVAQNGCGTNCSFCATISARGEHRFRAKEDIAQEVRSFCDRGGKEIVLVGINLGAWGAPDTLSPEKAQLPALVRFLLENTPIERIRISSVGAEFITQEFADLFAHTRVNGYIHISVQSASDAILRKMNRKYGREELLAGFQRLARVQRPDGLPISLGADIIAGFPGETETDFAQTLAFVRDFGISKVHAFPFSGHTAGEKVPAAFFPNQIDPQVARERVTRLIQEGHIQRKKFLEKCQGKTLHLLAEKPKHGLFSGWSENYIHLDAKNFKPLASASVTRGQIVAGVFSGAESVFWGDVE